MWYMKVLLHLSSIKNRRPCHICHLVLGSNEVQQTFQFVNLFPFSSQLLPSATKLGQGYVFTDICYSVNEGGVPDTPWDLEETPPWDLEETPPQDQVHPQVRYTPQTRYTPRTRCTPQDQAPLGPGTPPSTRYHPGTRYTPWTRYTPQTRYIPLDHVHPLPLDQVHPQDQVKPPGPGTPPKTRYTPQDQAPPRPGTPPRTRYTPPMQSMLGDTVNTRAVRILLECNLVTFTTGKGKIWGRTIAIYV